MCEVAPQEGKNQVAHLVSHLSPIPGRGARGCEQSTMVGVTRKEGCVTGDVDLIITPSNPLICLSPFGEYDAGGISSDFGG